MPTCHRDTLFSMKIPSISLSSIPSLSQMEAFATSVLHKGYLGIDIGSSTAKIVQLSREGSEFVLDTYGEMDLGPYGDRDAKHTVKLTETQMSTVIHDLLQAVDAQARRAAIAVPLSASLTRVIDLPKREAHQMDKIITTEAKPYIPVPIETVIVNWFMLSEEAPVETSIHALEEKKPDVIEKEKVMIIATEKDVVHAYGNMANTVGLAVEFLEVEFFSAARATMNAAMGPALLIDLGASATKYYAMNGHGIVVNTHTIPTAGEAVTEAIMKEFEWSFEKAEAAKRAVGFGAPKEFSAYDASVTNVIKTKMLDVFFEATKFIQETEKDGLDIHKVVLLGGGASMPGIAAALHEHCKFEVVPAQPFAYARGPIILEDVFQEVGPKFAVAMGLALRAITEKK